MVAVWFAKSPFSVPTLSYGLFGTVRVLFPYRSLRAACGLSRDDNQEDSRDDNREAVVKAVEMPISGKFAKKKNNSYLCAPYVE